MIYATKFVAHVALVIVAFIAAYSLRRGLGLDWWINSEDAGLVMLWAIIYGAIAGAVELVFRNEKRAWSYASMGDIVRLLRTTALVALTFLALIFISNRGISLPRSTLLLSWLLSLFFLVGVRMAWRLRNERSLSKVFLGLKAKPKEGAKALVLVGNPQTASIYLRRRDHLRAEFEPIAIVADDPRRVGQWIDDIPVLGHFGQLESLLQATAMQPPERVAVLFLEDPVLDLHLEAGLIGRLRKTRRPLLRLPKVTELKSGRDGLREISLEEFLPREPVNLEPAPIQALVAGRRVLVTGAGGSIGSEICKQLVTLGCEHITLIDNSEYLLFEIDRSLAELGPEIGRCPVLCDVRDETRVQEVMAIERPDIVFHAAALKHVTLVEKNPQEAVLTNVLGTWNVAEAARRSGAGQFVLISTDKAVDPTSVMGATKRLAESIFPASSDALRYCVVRFGNVLGSAGSVIPIFRSQIERGGPVTVTHPDVERYFMTIPEAVQLVLHAAAVSASSAVPKTQKFLLEMGRPVRILDLARQMIALCGLRPDEDVKISFVGLKAGEKITEVLVDQNEDARSLGAGLSELVVKGDGALLSEADVRQLVTLARTEEPDQVRQAVMAHVARIRSVAFLS